MRSKFFICERVVSLPMRDGNFLRSFFTGFVSELLAYL